MLEHLIDRIVPNADDAASHKVRTALGQVASCVGILCNALLFFAKLLIGWLSGSLAIAADAVNNLSDASSSIISLLGFKMGAKPADAEHPYGHGRYEYISGLTVSVMILVIGIELLKSSIGKILSPTPVEFSLAMVLVLALSIALKCWMMAFNVQMGRRIHSETLIATAADSRNDVVTTACILAGSILAYATGLNLDGWMGLAVAGFILYSGIGLVKDTLDPLLGRAPDEQEVEEIRRKILSYPGIIGTHDLMVHDYGPGRQFASVHVEISADSDPLKSHSVVDAIERDFLKERGLNLVVHMDPVADVDTALGKLNEWLLGQVRTIDAGITVHDLCILAGTPGKKPTMEFDCVVPRSVKLKDEDVRQLITGLVQGKYPGYACDITVDHDYAALPHSEESEEE